MNPQTHRLTMPDGQDIVLDWSEPRAAPARCAVFVHGLASERRGEKALYFAEQFTARGWGYLSFDLRGHGAAGGTLAELTLTRCLEDLDAALAWMPAGGRPPVLIGSSMGGAIAAWYTVTHLRPVGPLVLLAPSVRFPGHFVTSLPAEELAAWQQRGTRRLQSDWAEIHLGYALVEDGRAYPPSRLERAFDHRALIIQGMRDEAVNWQHPLAFVEASACRTLDLLLLKEGDHRLTDYKAYLFGAMLNWLQRLGEA
ncbi:MAG: alpha/beta fold hydrolase [Candidatus Lambdaproteobacteria bacterium]|nr:alpha/beta fold hydrolase [Candidatus Lambdaproteobacteria bacterium]